MELSDGFVLFNGRAAKKFPALIIIGEDGPKSVCWFPGRLAASVSWKGDEKTAKTVSRQHRWGRMSDCFL